MLSFSCAQSFRTDNKRQHTRDVPRVPDVLPTLLELDAFVVPEEHVTRFGNAQRARLDRRR